MKKLLLLIALIIVSMSFYSCGNDKDKDNDDIVVDEPQKEEHPREIAGIWVYYSGNARSVLTTTESDIILNHILEFAPNGYFAETITIKSRLGYIGGETSTMDGRWWVSGKQIMFSDKYGKPINTSLAYLFKEDSALSLNAALYYPSAKISNFFPSTIIGTWENYRNDGGKRRYLFNSNGHGITYSNYYDNRFFASSESITWQLEKDSLIIDYDSWAYPTSLHEYKINYLNQQHLSLKYKDEDLFYSRIN